MDILVDFAITPGLFAFVRLKARLEAILGRRVDLVTEDALKPALRERILRKAVHAAEGLALRPGARGVGFLWRQSMFQILIPWLLQVIKSNLSTYVHPSIAETHLVHQERLPYPIRDSPVLINCYISPSHPLIPII